MLRDEIILPNILEETDLLKLHFRLVDSKTVRE